MAKRPTAKKAARRPATRRTAPARPARKRPATKRAAKKRPAAKKSAKKVVTTARTRPKSRPRPASAARTSPLFAPLKGAERRNIGHVQLEVGRAGTARVKRVLNSSEVGSRTGGVHKPNDKAPNHPQRRRRHTDSSERRKQQQQKDQGKRTAPRRARRINRGVTVQGKGRS